MAVQNDNGFKSITAGEALAPYRCVRLNASAQLVYADDEEEVLGVTIEPDGSNTWASGYPATIKLMSAPGTFKIEADSAIAFSVATDERGTQVYVNADGKIASTGTNQKFIALEAASGDGSVIECMPVHNAANATA